MLIPKKLNTPTVIEAITEIRYKNILKIEEVFAQVWVVLQDEGYTFEKTPIADIPEVVKTHDKNLQYAMHYNFNMGKYRIGISPKAITFIQTGYYSGWDDFSYFFLNIKSKLQKLSSMWGETERVSMRYIDFFEDINIYDHITFDINEPDNLCCTNKIKHHQNYTTTYFCPENLEVRINIANHAQVKVGSAQQKGSIIDIDIFKHGVVDNENEVLADLHTRMKKSFFTILKENFVDTLGPEYEEIKNV